MAKLYKVTEIDTETHHETTIVQPMAVSEVIMELHKIAGREDHYFMIKVPEVGKPVEAEFATAQELVEKVAEHLAGEPGEIMIYRGQKVDVGEMRHSIPLTVGIEEYMVPAALPDPKEPEEPVETPPETPETPPDEAPTDESA